MYSRTSKHPNRLLFDHTDMHMSIYPNIRSIPTCKQPFGHRTSKQPFDRRISKQSFQQANCVYQNSGYPNSRSTMYTTIDPNSRSIIQRCGETYNQTVVPSYNHAYQRTCKQSCCLSLVACRLAIWLFDYFSVSRLAAYLTIRVHYGSNARAARPPV